MHFLYYKLLNGGFYFVLNVGAIRWSNHECGGFLRQS